MRLDACKTHKEHIWGHFPELATVLQHSWASLVAQLVKNLPAIWETWVRSLGWEDLLEKEMATHSSILAWVPHAERPRFPGPLLK